MAQERLSTGTIDDTAEFDSIMSRNFSADEAAAFDDMPIFANQAIEEDSYSLAYTRGERVSVIAASDTYVTSPDINNVYAEHKTGSERASLTRKIGAEATIASMTMGDRGRLGQWIDKKRTSALERFADNEHDSRIRKLGKKALRGTIEHAPTIVPAAALGGMLLTAYMGYRGMNVPQVTRTPEAHETELLVQSTVLAAGGRDDGNGDFIAQWLHESGQANGSEVMTTQYPAQIGPIDPVRMDTSLSIGANDMYNDYLRSNGEEVRIVGYSEGTGVAVETANRIAAENGGSLPSNVKVVLFAPPYAEGGLFDSSMIRAGSPMMNAMGIDTNMPIPPGTEVHYWDTDVYANGGDQQTMASRFRQALSLGAGGHDPLDQSKAG